MSLLSDPSINSSKSKLRSSIVSKYDKSEEDVFPVDVVEEQPPYPYPLRKQNSVELRKGIRLQTINEDELIMWTNGTMGKFDRYIIAIVLTLSYGCAMYLLSPSHIYHRCIECWFTAILVTYLGFLFFWHSKYGNMKHYHLFQFLMLYRSFLFARSYFIWPWIGHTDQFEMILMIGIMIVELTTNIPYIRFLFWQQYGVLFASSWMVFSVDWTSDHIEHINHEVGMNDTHSSLRSHVQNNQQPPIFDESTCEIQVTSNEVGTYHICGIKCWKYAPCMCECCYDAFKVVKDDDHAEEADDGLDRDCDYFSAIVSGIYGCLVWLRADKLKCQGYVGNDKFKQCTNCMVQQMSLFSFVCLFIASLSMFIWHWIVNEKDLDWKFLVRVIVVFSAFVIYVIWGCCLHKNWQEMNKVSFLFKTCLVIFKYQMALICKLHHGSSRVQFVMWNVLLVFGGVLLSIFTFTLKSCCKATPQAKT